MTIRNIQVFEHEVIPIDDSAGPTTDYRLTTVEATQLLRLNALRPGFCQAVPGGVKLAQYCGVLTLSTCMVEVLPKVGVSDSRDPGEVAASRTALLSMLRSARRLRLTRLPPVTQAAVDAPLLDIFVQAFLQCALEQARQGVLSRYVSLTGDLPVVRGRLRVEAQLRRNFARPHLLHCDYEEFTSDNPHNRAIRAALHACRPWVTHPRTRQLLAETYSRFAGVTHIRMTVNDVQRLPRERITRRYDTVLAWCESILGMASPSASAGTQSTPGLLFDMNKLFEAHVSHLELRDADELHMVQLQRPQLALSAQGSVGIFMLKPDITVWRRGASGAGPTLVRIVDAKWKRLDPASDDRGVDQADIYQMLAYALRFQCPHVELVYPAAIDAGAGESATVFSVPHTRVRNEICTVTIRTVPVFDVNKNL